MRRTWLSVAEAAERLGLSEVTVREQFRRGLLSGHRRRQGVWNRIYIDPVSVEHYRRDHLAPGQRGRVARASVTLDDALGPYRGPCTFCDADDARHRTFDAVRSRVRSGDPIEHVSEDYDLDPAAIRWIIEQDRFPVRKGETS